MIKELFLPIVVVSREVVEVLLAIVCFPVVPSIVSVIEYLGSVWT